MTEITTDNLEPGENLLDTWAINCWPADGGKFLGTLFVTNKRLLFKASGDASLNGLLDIVSGGEGDAEGVLVLDKKDIQSAEKELSFFKKKVVLHMKDGKTHAFDYGMLSVDKLYDAIIQS